MTETLSFPGLGLSFDLNRVAFEIAGFPIYWYGITFALAFLLGLVYFHFNARKVGVHPYEGLDVLLWAVIGGVIGARLYFVVFQWDALYKDNPFNIFNFRAGGLAIYGGVIGAVLVGFVACRMKKVPLLPMLDVGLPALLLGQAIGRWGNFFNIEAFGGNTTLPWGMTSKTIENYLSRPDVVETLQKLGETANPILPVHPTFFYEFLWNVVGFAVLAWVITPRRRYDGQVTLWYVSWYGLGRVFIEGLRTDSLVMEAPWGMIRVSQYLAGLCVVVGVLALLWLGRRARGENRPAWMGLYRDSEASAAIIARVDEEIRQSKQKGKAPAQAQPAPETVAEATAPEQTGVETTTADPEPEVRAEDGETPKE